MKVSVPYRGEMSVVQAVLDFISTELDPTSAMFPSPREADRFLYFNKRTGIIPEKEGVSVPSRGR